MLVPKIVVQQVKTLRKNTRNTIKWSLRNPYPLFKFSAETCNPKNQSLNQIRKTSKVLQVALLLLCHHLVCIKTWPNGTTCLFTASKSTYPWAIATTSGTATRSNKSRSLVILFWRMGPRVVISSDLGDIHNILIYSLGSVVFKSSLFQR